MRFPGASDPASFHELTVTGRRMFREVSAAVARDGQPDASGPAAESAAHATVLAALLDETRTGEGGAPGITDHHVLAAGTSAAALADVPAAFPAVDPDRIGAFIADVPSPGTRDVRDYVRWRLGLDGAEGPGAPVAAGPHEAGGHRDGPLSGDPGGTEPAPDSPDAARTRGWVTVVNGSVPRGPFCSLRAVTQACEALNAGEFDLVLAGGVATGIDASWMSRRMSAGALANREVRVYDTSPTGTLPGEGCGVVALVRAADARASGLPCYAEIAGWHAADPAAERSGLAEAYQRAGVDPADIQFVEGHGAATAAEDLAELRTLLDLLGSADAPSNRCALGTVTANIGDTRGAAGIAALLKTALAMTADIIPPSTGCVHPHYLLRAVPGPFRLPRTPEPWPQTPVQFAAVNSLGSAAYPDAPRSGPVHLVLRRERDQTRRPGRRRRATLSPRMR